jgi:hypothetical protein
MKKLWILVVAFCVMCSMAAVAQEMGKSDDSGKGKMAASAPLKTLKGTVKQDGEKITFVNDADQKSWDVMNPETLKDHVGHHVSVSAHVYADKDQIHVMSVKMMKAKEKSSM